MFNEIDGDFDDVAIRTIKVGLPAEHGLKKSLTGKPVSNVRQLMDRIDKVLSIAQLSVGTSFPEPKRSKMVVRPTLSISDEDKAGFDGKVFILMGHIKLLVQAGSEMVEVNFIMVDAFSPYTAILARPWLHALGAVSSTLHLKVK
ncbi:uncharacterized protein LOC142634159 [Castanea sativa]|uniref:uncharacterized protein LOC142634159 n=1 Tax=Castanea sativa TaxID=21020 RepID=UPI003F650E25